MPAMLPPEWALVRLTDVALLESGHTPSRRRSDYWDGDIPWVSLHDSDGLDVPEIFSTALTISDLGLKNSSARLLPKGTVVFSRTATVGKCTILGRPMATSQDFANYVCRSRLHNLYLMHLFRFMTAEWKRLMAGSTHQSIYMPAFENLQILLPPLNEQHAIAQALSDADALIESLEQLLAKKRQIKVGAMQELLTDKTRLPGFTEKWSRRSLGQIIDIRNDRIDPSQLGRETLCVELEDIEPATGRLRTSSTSSDESYNVSPMGEFRRGDVLFGKLRAYLRKFWLADCDGVCSTEIWIFVAKPPLLAPYLFQIVQMGDFINAASTAYGTHMPRSDWNVVKKYVVLLPSIPEQEAIVQVLSTFDEEIVAMEEKLRKFRHIKQAMMQQLLTGRIRLVDAKKPHDLQLVHSV